MSANGAVSQDCPCCGVRVTMTPYDIGSGPEMACPHCEWCWGADGQSLVPLSPEQIRGYASIIATMHGLSKVRRVVRP